MIDALTNPKYWLIVIILSALGVVTQYALYAAGRSKGDEALEHVPGMTSKRRNQMEERFERWGALTLVLASIPIIGQTAVALAGVGEVKRVTFLIIVSATYLARNWMIVILADGAIEALFA